jgi:hypothetical protein
MVLTQAQTTAFFESPDQLGIPHATIVQLQQEGIASVADLADFDKDSLQQLADNLRRPGGRVPDPNPAAAPGATIPTPSFVFGAKSQKRLSVMCNLIRYYNTVGRPITVASIMWETVGRNFEIQWKALKDKKDKDEPDVPKITKSLPMIKWIESFEDYLNRLIGVRMIPLAYVIRTEDTPPAAAPALMAGQPHSEEHGSVVRELVARASHSHALYHDDNADVYHKLEEATRTTQYAASIKPFQRNKDGRGAWMALRHQYAGRDKWEADIKRQENLLHTREWKGQSNFSLESFISQHRNAFVSLQACAEYVEYQLPNEHSRVSFLLDAIQTSDAGLQAAMAAIKSDDKVDGKRSNFEATASYLLPYDPVAKKKSTFDDRKRGAASISGVEGDDGGHVSFAAGSFKASIGKTGVHLRYHTKDEYNKLTSAQKQELKEWRESHSDVKRSKKKAKLGTKRLKSTVSKLVASVLKERGREAETKPPDSAPSQYNEVIASMVELAVQEKLSKEATASSTTVPVPSKPVELKSILKRAMNAGAPPIKRF